MKQIFTVEKVSNQIMICSGGVVFNAFDLENANVAKRVNNYLKKLSKCYKDFEVIYKYEF